VLCQLSAWQTGDLRRRGSDDIWGSGGAALWVWLKVCRRR
jgi:hypothetical protein